MGRPDTLGADLFHNRRLPVTQTPQSGDPRDLELLDHAHCAIIKCMVDLSRITKSICLRIYLPQVTLAAANTLVNELEEKIEQWVTSLPEVIRPTVASSQDLDLRRARDLQWMKRQRLVLTLSRSAKRSHFRRTLPLTSSRISQPQNLTVRCSTPQLNPRGKEHDQRVSRKRAQMLRLGRADSPFDPPDLPAQRFL